MGVKLSKLTNTRPSYVELTNSLRTSRTRSVIEYPDEFEECILIWLDTTIRDTDRWSDHLYQARQIINHLKTFDNPYDCITYMKMIVSDKIFLIVSE